MDPWFQDGGSGTDNTRLYHILGVSPGISSDEIPEVLDQLESTHRGDKAALRDIRYAATILSDPEFRHMYDALGETALRRIPVLPEDISTDSKPHLELEVTLREVYTGGEKEIQCRRSRPCSGCKGVGSRSTCECGVCRGKKQVIQRTIFGIRHVGCGTCNETGKVANPDDMCLLCQGRRVVTELVPLLIILKPGFPDKSLYRFYEQGDQYPGRPVGDYDVLVQYRLPPNITIQGSDVIFKRTLTLGECLGGYRFLYENFDGRKHWINSSVKELGQQPGYRKVKGLGLPVYDKPGVYGNLILALSVQYPTSEQMSPYTIAMVRELLPTPRLEYPGQFQPGQRHVPVPFNETHVTKEEERHRYTDHVDEDEEPQDTGPQMHCSGVLF